MIKKFEAFLVDRNPDYKHEEIVVAKHDINGLKKNRKYRLAYPQPDAAIERDYFVVYDIYNNEQFWRHKDNFISEMEYELGSDLKKYNL